MHRSTCAFSGTFVTSGPTGEQGLINTSAALPIVLSTNNTARAWFTGDGAFRIVELASNPTVGTSGVQVNMYMKGDLIVFQFNDGGTTRYLYTALGGTTNPAVWTKTTVAP